MGQLKDPAIIGSDSYGQYYASSSLETLKLKHFSTIIVSLLMTLCLFSAVEAVEISLDDHWSFRPDPLDQGRGAQWFSTAEQAGFEPISVGQSWESQGYPYDGYGWYRCVFELPESAKSAAIELGFDAVDEVADIWVNGMFVDSVDVGWNNPFQLDITDYVVYGRANILAVRIFDSARQGGIWKPVRIRYKEIDLDSQPDSVARLRRESVRALSAPVGHPSQAKRHVYGKMNLCVSWAYMLRKAEPFTAGAGEDFVNRACIDEGTIQRYYAEARIAKEYDLLYMPGIWVHNDTLPFIINNDYRRSVDFYGRQQTITPCPQSANYWQKMTLAQMRIIAEIQAEIGCQGGICLDLEWYAGDFSGGFCYDPLAVQGCYCDTCFGGFMKSLGRDYTTIAKEQRGDYIRSQGLRETYLLYLETRVAQQARRVCQELRTIKSDLLFGMLPGVAGARYDGIENWFTRGVVRGMGIDGLPALLFSETEYETGYCDRTDAQLEWLDRTGVPGMVVGGLTIGYFSGEGLAAKAAELAQHADGYWFYHGTALLSNTIPIRTDRSQQSAHTRRESLDAYWQAIRQANLWLDQQDATFESISDRKGEPLFTDDSVSQVSPGVSFTDTRVIFAASSSAASSPLVNGDFSQPFNVGWSTFDAAPVITEYDKVNVLLYDFAQRPNDQGYSSCYQTIELEPETNYQFTTQVMTRDLTGPRRIGVEISKHNSPQTLFSTYLTMGATDGVMHRLSGEFSTGDHSKVNVVLLANGHGGQIAFGPTVISPVQVKEITTTQRSQIDAVMIPDEDGLNCEWDLLNPETGIRYFGELQGIADLRYLNTIFPDSVYQFELSVTVPAIPAVTQIDQPIILNAQ